MEQSDNNSISIETNQKETITNINPDYDRICCISLKACHTKTNHYVDKNKSPINCLPFD